MAATLDQVLAAIQTLGKKLDVIMSQQDDVNTIVTAIAGAVATLGTAQTDIEDEIVALKDQIAKGQPVDLSVLDQKAAALASAVAAISAIAPPPAPPVS